MKTRLRFLAHFCMAMAGAVPFGVFGFMNGMNYGGNNGCFAWADALFGLRGYESCGNLGLLTGILVGAFVGAGLFQKLRLKDSRLHAATFVSLFVWIVLPASFGLFIFGFSDVNPFWAVPVILGSFSALAFLPALVAVLLVRRVAKKW